MDFTKAPPRSPFDELEGFPWLPRLLDKARATAAGTHGDYYPFPTPGDRRFLWYFGISAKVLMRMVRAGATDQQIGAYVKATCKRSAAEVEAYKREMYAPSERFFFALLNRLLVKKVVKRILAERPGADVSALDTMPKGLAFEEGHPVPGAS